MMRCLDCPYSCEPSLRPRLVCCCDKESTDGKIFGNEPERPKLNRKQRRAAAKKGER